MDIGSKIILSIILIISALPVLGVTVNSYSQIPDNDLTNGIKIQFSAQIIGYSMLSFVVFCVIWAIPETATRQRTKKEEIGFETEKVQIAFKEENMDEMLENGYVLNAETGKWEKPKR